ncbi:MAG TPA: hypothetical protein VNN76_00535 [Bacteroidota bacterium]|nr:hypothetical protein [Bacteroidota bacterium]
MNLNSFLVERLFQRLDLDKSTIQQLRIANSLSDVEGKGFPRELLSLSLPMVIRGLLNFGILQMKRDWVYPFWVYRQLDPFSTSHIPRSQNPLLMNITHRNWTALGTPHGKHEAIVDPRGLVTPLPREWSLDCWLRIDGRSLFPSRSSATQSFDPKAPALITSFIHEEVLLECETFVSPTRKGIDVLFYRAKVTNTSDRTKQGEFYFAIRPFNPEGVAPIVCIERISSREISVNGTLGPVLAMEPDAVLFGSSKLGDSSRFLRSVDGAPGRTIGEPLAAKVDCTQGLANAIVKYSFHLNPEESKAYVCSIALEKEHDLKRQPIKQGWKVSFGKRKAEHRRVWHEELSKGLVVDLPDEHLQNLFDSSRITLLQFQDDSFISPGPYLYHRFWFRDAGPMLRALDVLGYGERTRKVIDGFPKYLTTDGFFRGPDGEWDSNGVALWTIWNHFLSRQSELWLKRWYRRMVRAAAWIAKKRNHGLPKYRGLMPPSISAEHLGTVDQYYWDSFWSLAGLKVMSRVARHFNEKEDAEVFDAVASDFEKHILASLEEVENRLGEKLIPATPDRPFDESAIGSISCIYPLWLVSFVHSYGARTLSRLIKDYVDDKGFYHPIIHSGYNPYLTLQLAHASLWIGQFEEAWRVASTIFRQAQSPYSLPEAIHPTTGGGSMGDGHHGWASAEIVLFLRDCLLYEEEECLHVFRGAGERLITWGKPTRILKAPTRFGTFSCSIEFQSDRRGFVTFANRFVPGRSPRSILLHLPKKISTVLPASERYLLSTEKTASSTVLRLSPSVTTLLFEGHDV